MSMRVIAHSPHLNSTAEALRRVFLPNWKLHATHLCTRNSPGHQHFNIRYRSYGPGTFNKGSTTGALKDGPMRDEAIGALEIQVVGPDNVLQPPTSLRDSLASIDRSTKFLIQVGRKIHPRFDDAPGPDEGQRDNRPTIPVCKVVDKSSHQQVEIAKLKPKKTVSMSTKEIELNWNIAPHDLDHRLRRMTEFLNNGRKVEVVFGKKRKGWMQRKEVTDGKAKELVAMIRHRALLVEGSKESKEMEGQEGGELRMVFEAKRKK
ncbi:MAG: hypothetical protein Q9172_004641 [Xanthocarpia lactea]